MQKKADILKVFGERLRKIRESREITQMDVAVAINSTTGYISRLENGHTEPGITVLYTLAEALGCKPADLL